MASKNEDVHLRLFFDGAKAQKTYNMLIALQEEYNKQLKAAKEAAKASGVDPKNDPEVKNLKARITIINSILKETKKSYTDIHNALTHLSQQSMADLNSYVKYLESRINGMRTKTRSQRQEMARLKAELQQFKDEISSRNGTAQNRTLTEIQNDLRSSDVSINKLRALRQELEHLRNSTTSGTTRQGAIKELADLDARIKQMTTQPLRELESVLANIGNANNGSITRLRELREELVRIQTTSTNKADVRAASEAIADLDKRIAAMTGTSMKGADAERAYAQAQKALKDGVNGKAQVVRELVQQMKQAQQAEGISVQQSQKYAAAERQLTEMLRTEAETVMTAQHAHLAYNEAKRVIAERENASAAAVRNSIEQMKQAQQAEGISVQQAQMYASVQKQLEGQLRNTATQYMHLRQVRQVIDQGEKARVTDINRAVESLKRLSQAETTTAAQAQHYAQMITQLQSRLRGLAYDSDFVDKTFKNMSTAPLQDLERASQMLEQRMKTLQRGTKEYITTSQQLQSVRRQMDGVNKSFKDHEGFLERGAQKLMSYLGIFGGFYLARQKVTDAIQANLKYDDSLTNIQKTTQLTTEAVANLAEQIKGVHTRTSLEDITNLAYAAGKLGVKGVPDIMGFVRAADQINIALGEQLRGAESVEQLMKITQLMGTTDAYGLEQALLKTGSAINYLTMNSQATAQPMVDFMRRTAGVATQAGMTTAELTGLAGAVNALGQNVEMSATSISKMMVQISSNSQKVAAALKMDAQEAESFFYNISEGNMMGALMTVLQKTREQGGLSHLGTIVKDLGSEGQRVIQTIATLSQNYEKVREMVDMSTGAFELGTSATEEYNLKNANTAALWEKIRNEFSKQWVSIENITYLREMLQSLLSLPDAVREAAKGFTWLLGVVNTLIFVVTKCTWAITAFGYALATKALWTFGAAIIETGKSVVKLTRDLIAGITAANGFKGALIAINQAVKSNVFLLLATALASCVTYFMQAKKAATEFRESISEALGRISTEAQDTDVKIDQMLSKLQEVNNDSDQRRAIIGKMNSEYGEYLNNLLNENMTYAQIEATLKGVNAQMRLKALLTGKEESAKKIEQDNATGIGGKRSELVRVIKGFMINPDETTAREIADEMINRASDILDVKSRNENGTPTEYSSHRDWFSPSAEGRAMSQALVQVFRSFGATVSGTSMVGGVETLGGNSAQYRGITSALADYMNNYMVKEEQVRYSNEQYDADARQQAKKAVEVFGPETEKTWEVVRDAVTQGGKLVAGVIREGDQYRGTGYAVKNAEQDDKRAWVDRKKGLTDDQRNKEIADLENYLTFARQANTDLMLTDKEAAARLQVNISNAEEYLKILKIGNIENKPDKGVNSRLRSEGNDEYKNIIAKVEEFYKVQAGQLEQNMLEGKMTKFAYEDAIRENEKQLNLSLAAVRDAIDGDDKGEQAWALRVSQMIASNIAGASGEEVMGRIQATGSVRSIGEKLNAGSDEDRAVVSGMKKEAEDNRRKALKVDVDRYEADLKAMLNRNPVGKITDQYLTQFQEMGLMFANLSADTQEHLHELCQDVMAVYLQLGRSTAQFDVTSADGLQKYREYVSQLPHIGAVAAAASDEQLRSLYYETYQYAESYAESVSRLIERQRRVWERMYKQTADHMQSVARQADISRQMSGASITSVYDSGLMARLEDARKKAAEAEESDDLSQYNKAIDRVYKLQDQVDKVKEKYEDTKERLAELLEERDINLKVGVDDKHLDSQIEKTSRKLEQLQEQLYGTGQAAALAFGSDQLTSFGGSKRLKMEQDISLKREKLNDATGNWQSQISRAQNAVSANQQNYDNIVSSTDATDEQKRQALNDLDLAKQQLEQVSQMPDAVREATDALTESMMNLTQETISWASEMESAFESFADGIVPFRSWYEDNGSLADNIFGTKEERQEAFGEFMDDVKKTVRKSITEYVRLRTQKAVQDKMTTASEKMQDKLRSVFHKQTKAEEVATDLAAETTKQTADKVTAQQHMQNSEMGKNKTIADKTQETAGSVLGNLAQAVSKAFADLGPIAGAVAAGVVSAAIGAVLTMAMNALGSSSKSTSSSGAKTKLVSGMLTYDDGNVQSFPVMGDDGRVYSVSRTQSQLQTGMVTRPTLTTVGGAPALVGERGPEMVIGRETTSAMMMSRPDLIRQIVEFDRNRSRGFAKTFDEGNISEFSGDNSQLSALNSQPSGGMSDETAVALTTAIAMLSDQLSRPIRAEFNMNGKGGAADQMAQGLMNSRRLGDLDSVKRLFAR